MKKNFIILNIITFIFLCFILACGGGGGGDDSGAVNFVGQGASTTSTSTSDSSSNVPPEITISTPSGTQAGNISFNFILKDSESSTCNLVVEYTIDGGASWKAATAGTGSVSLYDLVTTPAGVAYSFVWDSIADSVGVSAQEFGVQVRIKAYDGTDYGEYATSTLIVVDNFTNHEPGAVLQSPTGTQSGATTLNFTLSDTDDDTCSITVEYTTDDGTTWKTATASGGDGITGLTASDSGESYIFIWDTEADNVGNAYPPSIVKMRVTPDDGETAGTAVVTDSFKVNNLSSGKFVYAGSMNIRRCTHKMSLLDDGNVLITGGLNYRSTADPSYIDATAEVYSTTTGICSYVGSMSERRAGHFSVKLNDGTVLVGGGLKQANISSVVCELYDPATGQFSAVGNMSAKRAFADAFILPNGKVLVLGGRDYEAGTDFASTELYDPATKTFGAGPNMIGARHSNWQFFATKITSKRFLIVGCGNGASAAGEIYDYDTNSFLPVDNTLTLAVNSYASVLLPSGRVLIAGGNSGGEKTNSYEYDPTLGTNGQFVAVGNLGTARFAMAAILLPNGTPMVVSGQKADNTSFFTTEVYDTSAKTFSAGVNVLAAKSYYDRAVQLNDGNFLFSGGCYGSNEAEHSYMEVYIP